jgi:hypothetical protein
MVRSDLNLSRLGLRSKRRRAARGVLGGWRLAWGLLPPINPSPPPHATRGPAESNFLSVTRHTCSLITAFNRPAPKGSIALADGRLYYRTERGTVLLIEPNPKEYVERGRFEQPERTNLPAWAHPVIANGKLHIRDQGNLFCYDIKAK